MLNCERLVEALSIESLTLMSRRIGLALKSLWVGGHSWSCGHKDIGACHVGHLRTQWQTMEISKAMRLKEEAFWAWFDPGVS